jgi:hypothetical protein
LGFRLPENFRVINLQIDNKSLDDFGPRYGFVSPCMGIGRQSFCKLSCFFQFDVLEKLLEEGIENVLEDINNVKCVKELEDMEGRVRLDVWYIENWSLSLDINIIFHTVWNVFKGDENAF